MATDPALIQQVARAIASEMDVTVRAQALISFNGRRSTLFIDDQVAVGGDPVPAGELVVAAP